jgi:hypothetical protein
MRITITLDDDAVVLLEQIRRTGGQSLGAIVNEALRQGLRHGLQQLAAVPGTGRRFRTATWDGGRCLVDNVDKITAVLARAEGEAFR